VILWGAYVRATGSGAGCGSHWPLCNGEVIPRAQQASTLIEFTHRMMSGLAFVLVVVMLIWAFKAFPKGNSVRLGATLSMLFMVTEALVGAGLVLFEWVAKDVSIGRVISISIHLVNTFLLLASMSLTAWWASGGKPISLRRKGILAWGICLGLLGVLLVGVSGSITALGDTLFPASTLAEGIGQDFSPTTHFLVRLRIWHPTIAITTGLCLFFFAGWIGMSNRELPTRRLAYALCIILAVQLCAGLVNVLLLAPVWMQIVHLFLADAVWITMILLSAVLLV